MKNDLIESKCWCGKVATIACVTCLVDLCSNHSDDEHILRGHETTSVKHEDKLFEHEGTCQANTGSCLDPENCGMTVQDFDRGDFEGYCDNCREDMEHALQCEMDLFYYGKSC